MDEERRRGQAMQALLSERELDILAYAARGLTYREVAFKVGLSHGSIKNTMPAIYRKLQEECLVGAMWAVGWVHIDWFPDIV